MSLISIDPFQFIDAWRRSTRLFEYAVLGVSLAFSATASFLFTCGGSLAAHRPPWEAIGTGMMVAAVAMAEVWRRKAPKGSVAVLPADEAKQELGTDVQVISK